jgi:hypothetical protein
MGYLDMRKQQVSEKRRLRNEEIKRQYAAGVSIDDLAVAYGLCPATICSQLGNYNLYRAQQRRAVVVADYLAGMSLEQIALKHGSSVRSVRGQLSHSKDILPVRMPRAKRKPRKYRPRFCHVCGVSELPRYRRLCAECQPEPPAKPPKVPRVRLRPVRVAEPVDTEEEEEKPRRPRYEYTGAPIEYCPVCHAPVSDWAGHYERLGHKRPMPSMASVQMVRASAPLS